jgi:hypothetical protein
MRRIRYRHRRNRGCWGKAYPESCTIDIDPEIADFTHLEIACHEAMHCLFPAVPEDAVNQAGITLADLLWRLGYRRNEDD